MLEIEIAQQLFELPARQESQSSQSGSKFLPCLGLHSKNHRANLIPCIFLQSPCQVDMKNAVKYQKGFLLYFTTLETYCGAHSIYYGDNFLNHKTSIHTFNSTPLFSFSWFAHLAQLQPWGAGVVQLTARQYIVEYLVLLFQTAKSGKNAAVYFGLKQTYF